MSKNENPAPVDGFHIVESGLGRGVVASRRFCAGDTVFLLDGQWVDTPTMYTIQLGWDSHLKPQNHLWALVNHSCAPNLRIDTARRKMVASSVIQPGDALSFNYLTTEWDMAAPFQCQCASSGCNGSIAGARYLGAARQRETLTWSLEETSAMSATGQDDEDR